MFIKNLRIFLKTIFLISFLSLTNCSTNKDNFIVDKTPEAQDPWENLNRGTFAFNESFDKYLLSPFKKVIDLYFQLK